MRVLPRSLRLPKREDAHFLSLIAVGALLMTVFVMFIGSAGHKAHRAESAVESFAPQWRQKPLQVRLFWPTREHINISALHKDGLLYQRIRATIFSCPLLTSFALSPF